VAWEEEELSYGELNARANRLAHYLRELGVKPDERVAICVERGFEMIVGLLAILKAGGGYVPLDPAYPEERLQYMLEDSAPVALLTQRHLEDRFPGISVPVLDLNATAAWQSLSESNPEADAVGLSSSHLAYVIYTSGSTGRPKGVMVEHRGLCNLSIVHSQHLAVDGNSRVLQFASFSFDTCAWETLMALCQGAALQLLRQEHVVAGDNLIETAAREGITHATLPPAVLAMVSERANVDSLRVLMVGGEAVPGWLAERWGRGRQLINAYGPTETTICVTMHRCVAEESGNPPIGRPIANTRVYILDSNREPVPVGVSGEMYIGGTGVARGYLKRPELTAERFVPDPFVKEAGARMYRTGDLGRWREDGTIEFVGRNDNQVKIRGFRIELGEIEARLAEHPEVREAVVLAREDTAGEKRLVAYYTCRESSGGVSESSVESVGAERLRAHLSAVVPDYMVPAAYVRMERLPLTPSGKLDRKALPAPEGDAYAARGYEEPVGEMETKLAEVWAEVLQLEKVGRHDNFFELGGHSLLAVRVVSRLQQVLSVEVAVRDLFAHPELADLARHLQGAAHAELSRIMPAKRSGRLPLSFAQQRLWFLAQMEGGSAAYHIPFGLHLKGDLNRTALRRALDRVVVRHEVLRTSFAFHDGEPVQEISAVEDSSFRLIEHDLRGHNDVEAKLAALRELEAGASFDLEAGPLIRGQLIRLAEDEHVLLITMHHIVSDGWSMGVLVSELNALYGAFLGGAADPLPELEIQYADYAVWQRQWIEGEILQQQAAYWKTTLAGAPALLELPTDHTRPVQQDFAGGFVELVLDEQLTAGLKDLSRRHGTTLYMTLLAGWAILLARLSGQQDVVIGSPVANRGRSEIENLIGFFVNTLALRLDLSGSPSVRELLQQTKAQSLAAQRHQDIPFEQVVELAQPVRSLAHSPLFQVMFGWQNATEARLELPGLEVQPLPSASYRVAKFDLTLSLQEVGERIVGALEYATALYERSTLERYREYFLRLVEAMAADDSQVVACVALLPEGERDQVLYGWNETKAEFPSGKCVHELFEEQVRRSPQATAVAWEEEELSYGELNARANRLAHYLRELGVKPDERVAICVERGFEMIVGLLAVLKAGGGYVPLDSGSARERLKYMLEDSGARLVLTSRSLSPMIREVAGPEVLLMEAEEWHRYSSEDPPVSIEPAQLAYVIYTSGSTGRPKGVGVEHRQLVNYVRAIGERLQIEAGMRLGLVSTYAADLGYTMIFPALCYGGCLDVVDAGRVLDASKLEEHFSRHPADYLKIVPSHLWALLNSSEGSGLLPRRWLILGGEASSWDLIQRVKQRGAGCQVLNHYGPTETTVGVLTYDTTQNDGGPQVGGMVPIGRPLRNGKVYVLDSELNPVGVGVSGEIYIGGAGVARGYLKRAELTAEKFLANPYSVEAGGRMYRTGDLGRFLENGNIEFLGRKDHQVKIRGFRVELGEIEAALVEHPKIRQAVVLVREDEPGDKRLVAYVVADQEAEEGDSGNKKAGLRISELREHMLGKLPEYMVPSAHVELEKLPLTHNGKIDRKALPQPDRDIPEEEYVGPQDATQETLCRLWQDVLRRDRVGIHDNFFKIGGHSLLAVQLTSRVRSAFAIEMPLSVLFATPTVARMAKHIAAANGHEGPRSSQVLVSIQSQGSRVPFFCVHAVGGQVISYAELSQEMGLEQPFYGLQSPPANFSPESDISIEQMATLYNREIRSVQPVGPYLLSGWSMGGLVAWEMAQQLMKEGETMGLLALMDTTPPSGYLEADDRADEISMLARFALDMSRLVGKDPRPLVEQFFQADAQDQWKMVQETLTSYGVLAPKTAHAEMTALLNVFTRNALAMNNYSLHPSDQSVVFFRASETPERFSKLWTKWSGGGIQFHLVPGDHFTMLRRPNVRIIAETLQRYISMNSNNESRAVSPEMSPRELIDIESQHTR
jgi:amino acid adenylation domain-containing protein